MGGKIDDLVVQLGRDGSLGQTAATELLRQVPSRDTVLDLYLGTVW